jgi:glycosyltransferase involved in cell wall biosynthesis
VSRPRVVAVVSFRLGGTDGVSVEAAKWERAWQNLGFDVTRVAGAIHGVRRTGDVVVPWLAIDAPAGAVPDANELATALAPAEIVVVENLCSLPLNLGAARVTADVLAARERPVVLHHHDLPWQRAEYASIVDLPPDTPDTLHVTINERSRNELIARGYEQSRVVHIPNCFDVDTPAGARDQTRAAMGFASDDIVVLQPTRAIARKNVPGALHFAAALQARISERRVRYWLTGPAEDGYGPVLDSLMARAPVPVTIGRVDRAPDAYAAADLVVFPSTWEGFGNPLVEAAIARRTVVAGDFPVREELEALGLHFLSLGAVDDAAACLRRPDPRRLDANVDAVRRNLHIASLPSRLDDALRRLGRRAGASAAS